MSRRTVVAALVAAYVIGGTVVLIATDEAGLLGTLLVGVMTVGAVVMLLLPSRR